MSNNVTTYSTSRLIASFFADADLSGDVSRLHTDLHGFPEQVVLETSESSQVTAALYSNGRIAVTVDRSPMILHPENSLDEGVMAFIERLPAIGKHFFGEQWKVLG